MASEMIFTLGRWAKSGSELTSDTTAISWLSRMQSVPMGYTPVAVMSALTRRGSKPRFGLSRISFSTASGGHGLYW